MKAIILTIGDEILIGQIVDTNGAWIAEQLNLAGIEVLEKRTVSDSKTKIKKALRDYEGKADLVILTGGLGPTRDDITKDCMSEYFGGKLVENQEVLDHIRFLFDKKGYRMSELNRKQALIPENCQILPNSVGTAPGMWFERSGTIFISLPGVPYEMKTLITGEVLTRLSERTDSETIQHRTVMTQGIPESVLAERIKDWELSLPESIKLAYLPRPGIVRLRLSASGTNSGKLKNLLENEINRLQKILPEDIFAIEDVSLEEVVGRLLLKNNFTLSTAESCTGGKIAGSLTAIPGSSAYFRGGVIAYSNQVKQEILKVPVDIIETYGAVSREVVELMAGKVREMFRTEYSVAVSGIAGPSGGTDEKPVGTTWICVSSSNKTFSKKYKFGDHRGRNIEVSSITALNLLRKMILGYVLE